MYEKKFDSFKEGREDKEGHFIVDKWAGSDTVFKLYFPDPTESYVRGITVNSKKGGSFSTIMDSMTSSNFLSIYNVPFDLVRVIYDQNSIIFTLLILTGSKPWY